MAAGRIANISYTVEGNGPPLFLVGAPAGISGFESLASLLSGKFRVVRHDPRGIDASPLATGAAVDPPALAEDLATLIEHLDAAPALVFGASGGAVTTLALLDRDADLVEHAVLHEPPVFGLLPDAREILHRADAIFATARDDPQEGMQRFCDLTELLQSTIAQYPRPERIVLPPLPHSELERQRFALGTMAPATVHYQVPDFRRYRDRITIAAGDASIGQVARRSAIALAKRMDLPLLNAPGNHIAPTMGAEHFAPWLTAIMLSKTVGLAGLG